MDVSELQAKLDAKFKIWSERLLDLSGRNRLLNFRPTKVSTIDISAPGPQVLFDQLVGAERSLIFPSIDIGSFLQMADEEGDSTQAGKTHPVKPGDLQTTKAPVDLEKSLLRLARLARASIEERGVNTLYLSMGMLEWVPAEGASPQKAPLILVPVSLIQVDRFHPYALAAFDEDPEVNSTLLHMLKRDFDLSLPTVDLEAESVDLTAFFHSVGSAVATRGWRVLPECWLAQFQFKKLTMFRDLQEHRAEAFGNARVRAIAGIGQFGEPPAIPSEAQFDDLDPTKVFTVLDADASQLAVLLRAREGQDLIVHGPPGTGKSQTIANLIAQLLLEGRRVLFVSEKMAALSVVHQRLEEAGLGPFCLEIHSDKANKRDTLRRIERAQKVSATTLSRETRQRFEALRRLRTELNEHVRLLHAEIPELGKTPFELHGRLANLHDIPDVLATIDVPIQELDSEREHALRRQAQKLASLPGMLSAYDKHPWFGCVLSHWNLASQAELKDHLDRFHSAVASILPLLDEASAAMRVPPPDCLDDLPAFCALTELFSTSPLPPATWLEEADLAELRSSAEHYQAEAARRAMLRDRLSNYYKPDLLTLDCHAVQKVFNESRLLLACSSGPDQRVRLSDQGSAISDCVRLATEELERVVATGYDVAVALGEGSPACVGETVRLAEIADIIGQELGPTEAWFSWEALIGAIDEAAEAAERSKAITEGERRLAEGYSASLETLDVIQWRDACLGRFANPIRRWFSAEYRRIRAAVAKASISGEMPTFAALTTVLTTAAGLVEHRAWLDSRRSDHARRFGIHYRGPETDWTHLGSKLGCMRRLFELYGGNPPPRAVRTALQATPQDQRQVASLAERCKLACDSLRTSLAALDRCLSLSTLLESEDAEDVEIAGLRTRLTQLGSEVKSYREAVASVNGALRAGQTRTADEQVDDLAAACEVLTIEQSLVNSKDHLVREYRHLFAGFDTDWGKIIAALDWCARFKRMAEAARLGSESRQAAASENAVRRVAAVSRQLRSFLNQAERERDYVASVFDLAAVRLGGRSINQAPLADLQHWLGVRMQTIGQLNDWIQFQAWRRECEENGLAAFVEKVLELRVPEEQVERALEKRLATLQLDFAYRKHPSLLNFQWRDHEDILGRFKQVDQELMAAYAAMVRAEVIQRQPSLDRPSAGQIGFLRRELAKHRRHAPLRKLFENSGNAILGLTPCLLMSPLSVATFLPKGAVQFDVVVFDEASQMPAEDAMGAILRGDQLIVAGDPNQLPPTRFFERSFDSDDDEEVEDDEPLESVLGDCQASEMQRCPLLWHYRSKHESLIAFSNAEFYKNELITFPSPDAAPPVGTGVRLDYVADGVYDRGRTRTNRREAQRVAQLVERHFDRYGNRRSLGVIALSTAQEGAIEEEILRLLVRRPDLEPLLRSGHEPFFVKPLENVQGDERDTIIISVGYGRGPDGGVTLNFGPLNNQGGERRLNVAVTRARWELVLVSSIQAHDIDDTKTEQRGPKLLKQYLAFARDGRLSIESAAPGGESESPFEAAVWKALTEAGYEADRQVGCSKYRIDIAVKDPDNPGRYLLGVECDGAMYHSSLVARDRDRLRQQVLESHSWTIHRIWSTDWVRDRKGALERLLARLEALRSGSTNDEGPSSAEGELQAAAAPVETEPDLDQQPLAQSYSDDLRTPEPTGTASDPYEGLVGMFTETPLKPRSKSALYGWPRVGMGKDLEDIVEHEGPIHRDLLTTRVARRFGAQRTGSNIRDIISAEIDKAAQAGRLVKRGNWFWPKDRSTVRPRRPGANTKLRDIKHVPPEELEEAAMIVAGISNGISRQDLTREAARLLGYQRTGKHVDSAVGATIDRLLIAGRLVERGGFIVAQDFQDPRPRELRTSSDRQPVTRAFVTPSVPRSAKASEPPIAGQPWRASQKPTENLPAFLRAQGLSVVDLRPNGRLWVAGRPPEPPIFKELYQLGIRFRHAPEARALDQGPGWWTNWNGDQAPPAPPMQPTREPPKPAEPPRPPIRTDTTAIRGKLMKAKNEKLDELPRTSQWKGGIELAAKLKDEIKQIDTALERLGDGTYGYCLTCGDWIGDRLEVVPWSNYCIDHLRRTG